ncbi:hypothetical protein CHS0354_001421 [Potamilus streckersoni]|uniref:Uncharacterized protein n=1 Tax=Potamilus streckersoni TaxID=2493646 RepID=A0AAE0T924_9BIVA|nr:hypothetical protein CHS0354_001421 [Potamilus streckersoni]
MFAFCLLLAFASRGIVRGDEYIFKELSDQIGKPGENVTFNCSILKKTTNGSVIPPEPLTIDWTFTALSTNVSRTIYTFTINNTDVTSSTSSNLAKYYSPMGSLDVTVISIGTRDAGKYECSIRNTGKQAVAWLSINEGVLCTLVDQKDNSTVYTLGETASFKCQVKFSGTERPNISWRFGGRDVSEKPMVEISDTLVTSAVNLTVSKNTLASKTVTCLVTFYTVSYPCFVDIIGEDRVSIGSVRLQPQHDKNIYLKGENVTLLCDADGYPNPQYTWIHRALDGSDTIILPATSRLYQLRNVSASNTGNYTCYVENWVKGQKYNDSKYVLIYINEPISASSNPGDKPSYDLETTTLFPVLIAAKGISPYAIGAMVSAGLAAVLIIIFIILSMKMRARERRLHERVSRMHDENLDDQEVELLDENIQSDGIDPPVNHNTLKQWEILRKDIRMVELNARGSYVEVWKGRMRKQPGKEDIIKVAIKKLVQESTEREKKFFLAELEVLKVVQTHPNVIKLIGCYTMNEPWLMMLEFASEGTLQQYLQRHRPGEMVVEIDTQDQGQESVSLKNQTLTSHRLLSFAAQVASGLEHLQKYKLIYYRLRAASVLMSRNGTCKLSGFGFPNDITERNMYEQATTPVRWMAPESLSHHIYTSKTDVWVFGVLLWEIVHFGLPPYPDMGLNEVAERVQAGYRMSHPLHCSEEFYNVMSLCWHENMENRPGFGDILQNLSHLAENADFHIKLENLPESLKTADMDDNSEDAV